MQHLLTWDGMECHLTSGPYRFITDEKPSLSFVFATLYYEPDAGNAFVVEPDGTTRALFEPEIEEILEYTSEWYLNHNFPVQAYSEPYHLFEGEMMKSVAESNGYKYTVNEVPEHPASKFVNGVWERIAMVVLDDGSVMEYPDGICSHCVAGFTANEMRDDIPPRPTPYYGWDLVDWCWRDFRSLEQAKIDAASSVRADFEFVRYARSSDKYFTPAYETENWTWQVMEAKAWLADNTADTPYIDTFLAFRTDENKPSKQELCEDIIANHTKFLTTMAEINAIQWSYLSRIKHAEDNDTCVAIMDEANRYCSEIRSSIEGAL